ncbi:MAG: glutaredoxin family protein [Acidobacteriota bacterium]
MSSSNASADAVTVYSTTWCPDCHRAKAFLKSKGVEYREIDIEAQPEAAETVAEHNNGKHIVPTFEIGGQFFGNPPLQQLGQLVAAR